MKNKILLICCLSVFTLQHVFAQPNAMKNGQKDGVWNYYGSNKILLARHFYNEGVKTGIWEFYTIDGSLWWTYNFNTSTVTALKVNNENGSYAYMDDNGNWVKKPPTQPAIWLASQSQWNNFLVNNLKFPDEAAPARVSGKAEIRVYIDEMGSVTGYKNGNDIEVSLDKEALRVTKLFGPEFVPASNNGKNVKSIYTLKVSYKLADYR
jgi:hypothetical protein